MLHFIQKYEVEAEPARKKSSRSSDDADEAVVGKSADDALHADASTSTVAFTPLPQTIMSEATAQLLSAQLKDAAVSFR